MELLKFIIYSISFVIGVQISKGDLKLLKGKIEYKVSDLQELHRREQDYF